jgi:hypothetical protein
MLNYNRYGISGISGLPICQTVPYSQCNLYLNTYIGITPTYDGENFYAPSQSNNAGWYNVNGNYTQYNNTNIFSNVNTGWDGSNAGHLLNTFQGGNSLGNQDFQSVFYTTRIKANGNIQRITQNYGKASNLLPPPNVNMQSFVGIYSEVTSNFETVNSFVFSDLSQYQPNPPTIFEANFVSGYSIDDDGFDFMFAQNNGSTTIPPPYKYRYNFNDYNTSGLYQCDPLTCRALQYGNTGVYTPGFIVFGGFTFTSYEAQSTLWRPGVYSRAPSSIESYNQWIPSNLQTIGTPPYSMPYIQGLNCFLTQIFTGDEFGTPYGLWFDMQAGQYVPNDLNNELNTLSNLLDSLVNGFSNLNVPPNAGLLSQLLRICVTRTNSGYVLCVTPSYPQGGIDNEQEYIQAATGTPLTYYTGNFQIGNKVLSAPYNEPYIAIYTDKTTAKFTPRLTSFPQGYSGNPSTNLSAYPNNPVNMWCSPTTGNIYAVYLNTPTVQGEYVALVTTINLLYVEPAITFNFNWRD